MRIPSLLAASFLLASLALLLTFEPGCTSEAFIQKSTASFPVNRGFLAGTVTIDGEDHRYAVFIPRTYDPSARYPAIVFLHGLFEGGSDGQHQLTGGLAPIIAQNPDAWPFVVIFPQSGGSWTGPAADRLAMACLDQAQTTWSIDPDRVILSGMSKGGGGVWKIGAEHRERFAALVPFSAITGGFDPLQLIGIPIWCFHNSADPLVSARASREFCKRIADAGGTITYTQFPAMAHDSCASACAQTDLVTWMLHQHRGTAMESPRPGLDARHVPAADPAPAAPSSPPAAM